MTTSRRRRYNDIVNFDTPLQGWYALHVSKRSTNRGAVDLLRHCVPSLQEGSNTLRGKIVGAVFFGKSTTLASLAAAGGCTDNCDIGAGGLHGDNCTTSPFAHGPICNRIATTVRFLNPLLSSGGRGVWRLRANVRKGLLQQLHGTPPFVLYC